MTSFTPVAYTLLGAGGTVAVGMLRDAVVDRRRTRREDDVERRRNARDDELALRQRRLDAAIDFIACVEATRRMRVRFLLARAQPGQTADDARQSIADILDDGIPLANRTDAAHMRLRLAFPARSPVDAGAVAVRDAINNIQLTKPPGEFDMANYSGLLLELEQLIRDYTQ